MATNYCNSLEVMCNERKSWKMSKMGPSLKFAPSDENYT